MRYRLSDGSHVYSGQSFVIGNNTYSREYLDEASPEQLATLGILADPEPDPPITASLVMAERERRLALGFTYDFGNGRGAHVIGTTDQDMRGWDEVTKATQAAIALGQSSMPLTIETNTGSVSLTALEWQQILLAATAFRQPIWLKSFALQAMSPIPSDYTDDRWWT